MIKCNKDYKIFKLTRGTSAKGVEYAIFKIKENVKDGNNWKQVYYKVFANSTCPYATEGGTVSFTTIDGVGLREYEYNGKTNTEVTIYVSTEGIFFKDAEDGARGETTNANPWGNDDLPF